MANVFVVPYIGTWIETPLKQTDCPHTRVVPYIGTWIETEAEAKSILVTMCRTLYRYVD